MTEQDRAQCRQSIIRHEGFSPRPIPDAHGTVVLGYGWNPCRWPMTEAQALFILDQQMDVKWNELVKAWPPLASCDGPRQRALLELCYQVGVDGLLGFRQLLHAVATKNHQQAAVEIMNSRLAQQTPQRAKDYAALFVESE